MYVHVPHFLRCVRTYMYVQYLIFLSSCSGVGAVVGQQHHVRDGLEALADVLVDDLVPGPEGVQPPQENNDLLRDGAAVRGNRRGMEPDLLVLAALH